MKYFTRSEFSCKCGCGFDTVDYKLAEILDTVRQHFGKPCVINSGCRCKHLNETIGGSLRSQHMLGRAADVVIADVDPHDVAEVALGLGATGVKAYYEFTHIDTRTGANWIG